MSESIIRSKAKKFAIRIVKLYKYLYTKKREAILSKQILRSGTSIGANLTEAEYAASHDDYTYKNNISLKEASETKYWLELLFEGEYLSEEQFNSLLADCEEIIKMLTA
ncbi:MAG: four helix bundle protein [Clostridiales bacterium]|jgi:four helix bundle protein|nr:four helix bundle protein [Clostridiales bacterium]